MDDNFLWVGGIGIVSTLIILVMLVFWLRRRKAILHLSELQLETEKTLAEYRIRFNELQSDLENCRMQARSLVAEKSQLEKEVSQLSDNVQKARDAGWLSTPGQIPYPEQIKTLKDQLSAEETNKKILEQDLYALLRKLRGEEE